MKVLGLVWVGVRTDRFDETLAFFRDVLGVELDVVSADFAWSRMPNTSQLEVFGPGDPDHTDFVTGPVPEFLVEDITAAIEDLRASGVEIVGRPAVDADNSGWAHFRGPDGNLYGVTSGPQYRR